MTQKTNGRPGIPDLVGGISSDAERLVQLNIELAKQETRELAVQNGVAVGLLAAGAVFALLTLIGLLVFAVEALPFPGWATALGWFVLALIITIVLLLVGRARLRLEPPRRTIQSLKETKEWVVHQLKSSGR